MDQHNFERIDRAIDDTVTIGGMALGSAVFYGLISSGVVTLYDDIKHKNQFNNHVLPLEHNLSNVHAQELKLINQGSAIPAKVITTERQLTSKLHTTQASIQPASSFADWFHHSEQYTGDILVAYGAIAAVAVAAVASSKVSRLFHKKSTRSA